MTELEVFKAPADLADEMVKFFDSRACHPLSSLDERRVGLERYIGVYALYYRGDFDLYGSISEANSAGCAVPIYVGKAIPSGARTGRTEQEGMTRASNNLYKRLHEHRRSINQSSNLDLNDFDFKVAPMEINLVSWGESLLIGHLQPAWNQVISGFGIHDPGSGRAQQQRSVWDRLHPGRTAANRLPASEPVDEGEYSAEIGRLTRETRERLGL